MKREHFNADCTHLVPYDSPTVLVGTFTDLRLHRLRSSGSASSWIQRTFWSNKKRKGFSILGILCCSVLIAASGYFLLRRRGVTRHE